MCPSGAGQHAPGHDIRGQHGGLAWSCCDFNMFGFTWASDRSCLSTAASSCSRLGVCRQVTYDQSCPGVLLPADVVWSLEGAHLPRNERATLEVAIAIVRPNLAANRSCSVQTWSRLPLTPWVQCTTKLPRYTGAHLPAWTALMRALNGSDLTSHRSEPSSLSRCPRFRACATERAHDSVSRQIACCYRLDLPSRLGTGQSCPWQSYFTTCLHAIVVTP